MKWEKIEKKYRYYSFYRCYRYFSTHTRKTIMPSSRVQIVLQKNVPGRPYVTKKVLSLP